MFQNFSTENQCVQTRYCREIGKCQPKVIIYMIFIEIGLPVPEKKISLLFVALTATMVM